MVSCCKHLHQEVVRNYQACAACAVFRHMRCSGRVDQPRMHPFQDMAELESAVADNLLPVDAIGAPHRVLRAFRPLIFLGTPELASSLLLSAVPLSMVLHHMYSRAPEALQSPHTRSGFTPAQVQSPVTCPACKAYVKQPCSIGEGLLLQSITGRLKHANSTVHQSLMDSMQANLSCSVQGSALP